MSTEENEKQGIEHAHALTEKSLEAFLYREARLLDEWRLNEWLDLWTDDGRYWVPIGDEGASPGTQVSIIYDDHQRLRERVFRLTSADAHSQEPRSRTTHHLMGMEFFRIEDDEAHVRASTLIVEVRKGIQEVYSGRVEFLVRRENDCLRLAQKTVWLTRSQTALGNLTFLL